MSIWPSVITLFVAVTDKGNIETKQIVIGIVTRIDLINFITNEEEQKSRSGTHSPSTPVKNGSETDDLSP